MTLKKVDCLVVGGGPAGLTAATYLARFRRSVLVIDDGNSRASKIPVSHNIPGFPEGLSGHELLVRHREQAAVFDVGRMTGVVGETKPLPQGGFLVSVGEDAGGVLRVEAKAMLLATGVRDREPNVSDVGEAIRNGLIRHCPVCDAFEAMDQDIAVLGSGRDAVGEAVFLRTYSERITLLVTAGATALTEADRGQLASSGVRLVEAPVTSVRLYENRATGVRTADGAEHRFDTLYSALGADARSELAAALGCELEESCGAVVVDAHQRTGVPGLWAAGDVVSSLNQVSVAWGHAAIAATDIHNHLRHRDAGDGP